MYGGVWAVLGGSIIVLSLALKWGESISMSEVLYSTKRAKHVILQNCTRASHKTQQQHNNQHDEPPPPNPQWLWPSLSMVRAMLPPNHYTAAPLWVCTGCEPSGLFLPASVHLFGAPKWHPTKKRGGDGAQALGGCQSMRILNNQPKIGGIEG